MNRYRKFYLQTSTLPPCMHHKLTKHGRFCKQNNQLPTKTRVELKDKSVDNRNQDRGVETLPSISCISEGAKEFREERTSQNQ